MAKWRMSGWQLQISDIVRHFRIMALQSSKSFSKGAILFGGGVAFAKEGATAEKVEGEIHLDSSGDALAVAVGGKMFVVGFGQFLLGGILDEDPAEGAFKVGDMAGSIVPFFEQGEGERVEHEGEGIGALSISALCLS
jgi:hypothetical protein